MIRTYRLTETDLFMRRWPLPERRVPLDSIAWRHVDRFKGTCYLNLETTDGRVFAVSDLTPSGKKVYFELYRRLGERGVPAVPSPDSKLGRRLQGSIRGVFHFSLFMSIMFLFALVKLVNDEEPLEHLLMIGGLFVACSALAVACARKLT